MVSAARRSTAGLLVVAAIAAMLSLTGAASARGNEGGQRDREDPSAPTDLRVASATASSVTVAWTPATDNVGVTGYSVYIDGRRVSDGRRESDPTPSFLVSNLSCGQTIEFAVLAVDEAGNRSRRASMTVSAAPCRDSSPPSMPTNFRQSATTQTQVMLSWDPATDNVGVVGYGLYRNGVQASYVNGTSAAVTGLTCGSTAQVQVDAVDAGGNHSQRATAWVQAAACGDATAPSAPSNLAVTGKTATSLSLAWAASSDNVGVAGYRVTVSGRTPFNVTGSSATATGLSCNTSYTVTVDAYDAAGNRSSAVSTTATTSGCATSPLPSDTTAPSQPTGLSVTARTTSSLTLAWTASTDNVGVTGYRVAVGGGSTFTVTGSPAQVTGLACNTSYTVSVDAYDAAGNRSAASSVTAATSACAAPPPGDTTPPSQPSGLAVTAATATSLTLGWNASTDNVGVVGYTVSRAGATPVTVTTRTALVSGLACGTAYTVSVDAYDAAGNHSPQASVTASTGACPDTVAPTQPTNVVATTRTATSIAISWTPSTDNVGVVGYGTYRGTTLVTTAPGTTAIFTGLTCNTNYSLAVDAVDAAGNRSTKAVVAVATTACADTTPPATPTALTASSVTPTSMMLSWTAATDNVGVTGYEVMRNGTKTATVTTTSSSQSPLACATSYSFAVVAVDAAGNRSPQAQMSASTAACTGTTPVLQEVDGGVGYYGQFSNGLPSNASYFPIGVWYEAVNTQAQVDLDRSAGLNTYVVLTGTSDLSLVRANGMKVFLAHGMVPPGTGSETAGWELKDEIDMVQANAAGAAAARAELDRILASLPNDGRAIYNNYGKGVLFWNDDSDAARYVNDFQDIVSTDVYWFNDNDVCSQWQGGKLLGLARNLTASECHRASNYGAQVKRVRSLVSPARSKPVWGFVELGVPFSNMGSGITPEQVRSAVWHNLIAGARGIIYFNHSFGGSCISQHILREPSRCNYGAIRSTVTAVNTQIRELAFVLNAPFVSSGWTNGPETKAMVKWAGGQFYVFAGSADNVSSTSSFSLPCVGNATATVIGENRSIPVTAGSFSDSFADGNAVHIYRIDGGSTCGLT